MLTTARRGNEDLDARVLLHDTQSRSPPPGKVVTSQTALHTKNEDLPENFVLASLRGPGGVEVHLIPAQVRQIARP